MDSTQGVTLEVPSPIPLTIGWTASRFVAERHFPLMDVTMRGLSVAKRWVTGGAVGGDTYLLRKGKEMYPYLEQIVCIPESGLGWDNKWLHLADKIIEVPDTMNHPMRSRNHAILDNSDFLMGLPLHPEDHGQSTRSGTWMTIRIARQRGFPHSFVVLD